MGGKKQERTTSVCLGANTTDTHCGDCTHLEDGDFAPYCIVYDVALERGEGQTALRCITCIAGENKMVDSDCNKEFQATRAALEGLIK